METGLFARYLGDGWRAGGYLDAEARLSKELSLFGQAEAGWDSAVSSAFVEAVTGVRLRF